MILNMGCRSFYPSVCMCVCVCRSLVSFSSFSFFSFAMPGEIHHVNKRQKNRCSLFNERKDAAYHRKRKIENLISIFLTRWTQMKYLHVEQWKKTANFNITRSQLNDSSSFDMTTDDDPLYECRSNEIKRVTSSSSCQYSTNRINLFFFLDVNEREQIESSTKSILYLCEYVRDNFLIVKINLENSN